MTEARPNDTAQESSHEWHDDGLADVVTALEHEGGVFHYRGWAIRYDLAADNPELSDSIPGEFGLVSIKDRYDIVVRVWQGVPETFRKAVLYHEIQEATIALGDADDYFIGGPQRGFMDKEDAHIIAERLHWDYARQHLSSEEFVAFQSWDAQLPRDGVY